MKSISRLLLCLGLVACVTSSLDASDLQVADVLQELRHNASLLQAPYVRWTCVQTQREGMARLMLRQQRLDGGQSQASAAAPQDAQQSLPVRSDYEMWMNGSGVHLRSPKERLPIESPPGTWRSPSSDVDPARLIADFSRVLILSLNPKSDSADEALDRS